MAKSETTTDNAWETNPENVKRFLDVEPGYAQLSSEVAYSLTKEIENQKISVAAITHRAKKLESFLEKIGRKSYADPFNDIQDLAGARVVCYYADDLRRVSELIHEAFDVIEHDDKTESAGVDRFGYGGIHFLVKLGKHYSGARYDDLKDKLCEVQLRTVMQDAWAIVSHQLLYKREQDMPQALKRGVNALSGALDAADIAFQAIRTDRDAYLKEVTVYFKEKDLTSLYVNIDSMKRFLEVRFPDRPYHNPRGSDTTSSIAAELISAGYETLGDVSLMLDRTEQERNWFDANHPLKRKPNGDALYEVSIGIFIDKPELRPAELSPEFQEAYERANKMVKT